MHVSQPESLRLCLFGAGPGTGNLGVSALGDAVLVALARRMSHPQVTVFDNGQGLRPAHVDVDGRALTYQLCGAVPTRRLYHRDSLWRIRVSGWLGGLGHHAIGAIRDAHAVLDSTSGDSFTDLYSRRRYRLVTTEKLMILEQGRPLILLPQTIGPFSGPGARRVARRIIGDARMVWTRDQQSLDMVLDLLGTGFDPARHRAGVDLAFLLEPRRPHGLSRVVATLLEEHSGPPLVGFNISGLLYNQPSLAARRFGLRADYRQAVHRFLRLLLDRTDARILLVPHVFATAGHPEHDPDACAAAAKTLDEPDRIILLPEGLDAAETKWVIGRTNWFCATRMHAAIAALSQAVPAAAVAYSRKTRGVFETCDLVGAVADGRLLNTDDVVDHLWGSWEARADAEETLTRALPHVQWQANTQMDEIVASCVASSTGDGGYRMAA